MNALARSAGGGAGAGRKRKSPTGSGFVGLAGIVASSLGAAELDQELIELFRHQDLEPAAFASGDGGIDGYGLATEFLGNRGDDFFTIGAFASKADEFRHLTEPPRLLRGRSKG